MSDLRDAESFFRKMGDGVPLGSDIAAIAAEEPGAGEAPVILKDDAHDAVSTAPNILKLRASEEEMTQAGERYERDRTAPLAELPSKQQTHHHCSECLARLSEIQADMPIVTGTLKRMRKLILGLAGEVFEGFEGEVSDVSVDEESVDDLVDFADHVLAVFAESASSPKDMKWVGSLMRLVEALPEARDEHIARLQESLKQCADANARLVESRPQASATAAGTGETEEDAELRSAEVQAYLDAARGTQVLTVETDDSSAHLVATDCPPSALDAGVGAIHVGNNYTLI